MRSRVIGVINMTALLTIVSILSGGFNVVQAVYNLRYFRADKRTAALEALSKYVKDSQESFQKEFDDAVKITKGQVRELDLASVESLKGRIAKLASDGSSLATQIQEHEQVYRNSFNKSYPLSDLSWIKELTLDKVVREELRQRYLKVLNAGPPGTASLEKLLSFAGKIDPRWVEVSTKQSVNIRSEPRSDAGITAAIPPATTCTVLLVTKDQSWLKVRGEAPNAFEGWVYTGIVEIPSLYFLN